MNPLRFSAEIESRRQSLYCWPLERRECTSKKSSNKWRQIDVTDSAPVPLLWTDEIRAGRADIPFDREFSEGFEIVNHTIHKALGTKLSQLNNIYIYFSMFSCEAPFDTERATQTWLNSKPKPTVGLSVFHGKGEEEQFLVHSKGLMFFQHLSFS